MVGKNHAIGLSVIVAVRDVEDSIGRDVRALAARLRARGIAFEILAASDGSCDTSLTLLRLLCAEIP
jgi:glycosyltransferase involved in cell wall biosynthesis